MKHHSEYTEAEHQATEPTEREHKLLDKIRALEAKLAEVEKSVIYNRTQWTEAQKRADVWRDENNSLLERAEAAERDLIEQARIYSGIAEPEYVKRAEALEAKLAEAKNKRDKWAKAWKKAAVKWWVAHEISHDCRLIAEQRARDAEKGDFRAYRTEMENEIARLREAN